MSIKKFGSVFLVALFVLSTPFAVSASEDDFTTYAGNGKWDYIGQQSFAVQSNEVKSNGGDFKFCTNRTATFNFYNAANNKRQELIGTTKKLFKNECAVFRNLNKYVDGKNNKAEFIVTKQMTGAPITDVKKATVKFYD